MALNTTSEPNGLLISFPSQPEAAKSASIRSSTSVNPSERIMLMPLLISVIFCIKAALSLIPLGVSVPSPRSEPKITDGSIATMTIGSAISATMTAIHFFEVFAASIAAPWAPPTAAPFAIFAIALPVLAAPPTVDSTEDFSCLVSSLIRFCPFFSVQGAFEKQSVHHT